MPLWDIETHDDGLDPHCDNCLQPFSGEAIEVDGRILCPKCLEIHHKLIEEVCSIDSALMRIASFEADLDNFDALDKLEFDDTEDNDDQCRSAE